MYVPNLYPGLMFYLISHENSSHQRRSFPFRPVSFLGLIFFCFLIRTGGKINKKISVRDIFLYRLRMNYYRRLLLSDL